MVISYIENLEMIFFRNDYYLCFSCFNEDKNAINLCIIESNIVIYKILLNIVNP